MREHSRIRRHRLFGGIFSQAAKHSLLTRRPHDAVIGKMNPSEEIDARGEALDINFVGMKGKLEPLAKKCADLRHQIFQVPSVARKNREIIGVAEIIFYFQIAFHELIELVHIDVHEELRGKIAERKPHARSRRRETPDHFSEKPADSFVGNPAAQNLRQRGMIDGREELPDIAFQNPYGFRIIRAFFAGERIKTIQSPMRSLVDAAGIRVSDECRIEERIKPSINGMMKQTVPHGRLMDIARFRVANVEGTIRPVPVGTGIKIPMQQEDMIHEAKRKCLDIGLVPLADDEFSPRLQEIFYARDVVEDTLKLNHI